MPSFSFLQIRQPHHTFKLTAIPVSLLTRIAYAAVRRQDDEIGAVQRVLISSRISGVRDFALQRGDFPASVVLNWVSEPLIETNGQIDVPEGDRLAQIIDGQHRVAGLKEAMNSQPDIGQVLIPVAIYSNLDTQQAAKIFLSINTEQRPVPKSLVFDLYGVAGDELMDPAALRARDIISDLNAPGEPYDGYIKFPNLGYRRGGIALSTAVDTIKPLVEVKGILEQNSIRSLELQTAVFMNFFRVLRAKYEGYWQDKTNVFIYAAGFTGAVQFFRSKLIDYCIIKKSFEQSTIADAISLSSTNRILQEEIRGLGGAEAANKVFDRLTENFAPQASVSNFKI